MKRSIHEPIEHYADRMTEHIENSRANRTAINRIFRLEDQSHLYPIRGRFNATERAIRRVQQFMRESGQDLAGLEYSLTLDDEISRIVNNEA